MSWNPPTPAPAPPRRLSDRVGLFFRPPPERYNKVSPDTPPAIDENPVALPPQPLSRNPTYRPPHGGAPDHILPAIPFEQPQWRQPPQEPYQQWRAAEQTIVDPTPRGAVADIHARAELNPPYGPSSGGEALGDLVFEGRDGAECEAFVQSVKKKAFGQGKLRDDEWMAAFAGQALRWFEALDVATQSSWNLLRQALLAKYPATASVPQSTSAAPQTPLSDIAEVRSQNPFIPTPSAASPVPRPPPSHFPSMRPGREEAAPVPAAMTNPAAPPPRDSNMRQAFHLGSDFASLKLGESMSKFWVRVECSDPAASGYISKAVTTKSPTAPSYGFHTVVSRQLDAMIVKENLKRIDPTVVGSLTVPDGPGGYNRVGLTWFETSPNYLGRGAGHTSYAHLTALKYDKDGDLETTYKNDDDGSYGDYDTDIEITGVDIWKRGTDGVLTPCWKDYNGKYHDLDVAVCLHDKEISLAADYDEFAKLYGPKSFRRARLVLESKPK